MTESVFASTSDGAVIATSFGFGAKLGGLYTPSSLYREALALRKDVVEAEVDLESVVNEHQYVWCPWSRVSVTATTAMSERSRMPSQPVLQDSDVTESYAGSGQSYAKAWSGYYSVADRITALTLATGRDVNGLDDLKLLDLGCAGGRRMAEYAAHGAEVYGIELNKLHVALAPAIIRPRIVVGDALVDTYAFGTDSFNACICSVLGTTHFHDVQHLARELARILVPTGGLVLDVPTKHDVGPCLESNYRVYLRAFKDAGFTPSHWFEHQVLLRRI